MYWVNDPTGQVLAIVFYILRGPSAMKQIEESEAPMKGFGCIVRRVRILLPKLHRSIGEDAHEKKQG
jgi:hypothetical protein